MEKFYFFVTTVSDQDPDPHWFGALNSDPYPHGNQVRIHNTEAGVLKKLSLAGLAKLS
jgi:hypothetical protein